MVSSTYSQIQHRAAEKIAFCEKALVFFYALAPCQRWRIDLEYGLQIRHRNQGPKVFRYLDGVEVSAALGAQVRHRELDWILPRMGYGQEAVDKKNKESSERKKNGDFILKCRMLTNCY